MAKVDVIKEITVRLSENDLKKLTEARDVLQAINDDINAKADVDFDNENVEWLDYVSEYPARDKFWDIYSLLDEVICCYQA